MRVILYLKRCVLHHEKLSHHRFLMTIVELAVRLENFDSMIAAAHQAVLPNVTQLAEECDVGMW